jgi:hypothetical protein
MEARKAELLNGSKVCISFDGGWQRGGWQHSGWQHGGWLLNGSTALGSAAEESAEGNAAAAAAAAAIALIIVLWIRPKCWPGPNWTLPTFSSGHLEPSYN